MTLQIAGKNVKLDPKTAIGKGGEADIFKFGQNLALKIFKTPDHPDIAGDRNEAEKARRRIKEHQQKLRNFPKNLPPQVIVPLDFVLDDQRQIAGYVMRLVVGAEVMLLYGEKKFRLTSAIDDNEVTKTLLNLHSSVEGVHQAGVVIGDFNDLNVLVKDDQSYLIDADSFQFGKFFCQTYTTKFVDPLLCDPKKKSPELVRPHNKFSDWYAYNVMVMQSLLFVGPYGGVYQPKKGAYISLDARPLERITVFSPEVIYPKPARHFSLLPDDLLHHFEKVFCRDDRNIFPRQLLLNLRWQKCLKCGELHARVCCPKCATAVPGIVKEVEVIRGKVKATRIFKTSGVLLAAGVSENNLGWLYHQSGKYFREGGKVIKTSRLMASHKFRIAKEETLIGLPGQVTIYKPDGTEEKIAADNYLASACFDANQAGKYWCTGGALYRNGRFGPEFLGQVLQNQTQIFSGEKFGFGFYRAGAIFQAFVFDSCSRGLNDTVKIPKISGQLIDAAACFTHELCWFFITIQEGTELKNKAFVISRLGKFIAGTETLSGDGSWLGTIHGKVAMNNFVLAATDNGIVRAEISGNSILETKSFPDTEPFVESDTALLPASGGLWAVKSQEILKLVIS